MNLWILTEERPKKSSLRMILEKFAKDNNFSGFMDNLRIIPILEEGKFCFTYEVIGFHCNKVSEVFIKIVSGASSFVDFLIFFQDDEPHQSELPLYCIEETKTDDSESRNTGVYQRCSKFILVDYYYPKAKKIMLYNLKHEQKQTPTETNIFGTCLLITFGVEIIGKQLDKKLFKAFETVQEIIDTKNSMHKPPKGNVPIEIIKTASDSLDISGRLWKANALAHDPNIGALSIISAGLRKLGWRGNIVITKHGLQQKHIKEKNKFIFIAALLGIHLDGLHLPKKELPEHYWHYDIEGEKLATIFLHIAVENFTQGQSIFENHAGCKKGYFITAKGEYLALGKYQDRERYKSGDKTHIIAISDLILLDNKRREVINIEGKKYKFRNNGIEELSAYNAVEKLYIAKYYPNYSVIRAVVLYGGKEKKLVEIEVGFLLNDDGDLVLGVGVPLLFGEAIKNLSDFWN